MGRSKGKKSENITIRRFEFLFWTQNTTANRHRATQTKKKKNQSSAEQSRDRACFSFTSATRSEVNLRCAVIVI